MLRRHLEDGDRCADTDADTKEHEQLERLVEEPSATDHGAGPELDLPLPGSGATGVRPVAPSSSTRSSRADGGRALPAGNDLVALSEVLSTCPRPGRMDRIAATLRPVGDLMLVLGPSHEREASMLDRHRARHDGAVLRPAVETGVNLIQPLRIVL